MARTIERGNPVTELVKGSMDYTMYTIRRAFRRQFPYREDTPYHYIDEIFDGYVIVYSDELEIDEYYRVPYERDGDAYVFADREEWEVVELAYRPATMDDDVAESKKGEERPQRFTELVEHAARLEEVSNGAPRTIRARLAQADVVNENGRRYPASVMKEAVREASTHLHESLSQGRAAILGEAEHPSDKRQRPRFLETIVVWRELDFDEATGWVMGTGEMVETAIGRDAIVLMDAGVLPGVSLRGYGESKFVEEDGRQVEEVEWLTLTGFDLVLSPGFRDAAVDVIESKKEEPEMGAKQPNKEEATTTPPVGQNGNDRAPSAAELRENHPEVYNRIVEEAIANYRADQDAAQTEAEIEALREREAHVRELLGLDEDADVDEALQARTERLDKLEAAERRRTVQAHIAETVKGIEYPPSIKESFVAYVNEAEPATVEEADEVIEGAKAVFNPLAADIRLAEMGARPNITRVAPVIEEELGIPEFARPAWEITESLVKRGVWQPRKERPESRNALFARKYLERWDEVHQDHLIREAKMWNEAMLTTQLSLPYQVLRAIMDEAFPQLVATSIFDTDVVDANPVRVYYEIGFTGETGYEVTVTDEDVTSDEGAWVDLNGHHIEFGTVNVEPDGGGTAYVEGVDYVIDYFEGRLWTLASGSIGDATALDVDYDYRAVRKGENAAIERSRSSLSYVTLDLTANRLATEISDETIKFSQSQLGLDAVARTINLAAKELMKLIDGGLFYFALAQSLKTASNSGGTWTAASDSYQDLSEKIGAAKVKVANRNYDPEFVLMSVTNSDRLSNWDGFTAAGSRPGTELNAAGYVGRVKGLPAFESTNFTDGYILVGNGEIVQYRTFGDMELKGPYPTYSSGELVANDQFFIQQYDGFISPLTDKAAHVVVS